MAFRFGEINAPGVTATTRCLQHRQTEACLGRNRLRRNYD
jgi:hypothetical protein